MRRALFFPIGLRTVAAMVDGVCEGKRVRRPFEIVCHCLYNHGHITGSQRVYSKCAPDACLEDTEVGSKQAVMNIVPVGVGPGCVHWGVTLSGGGGPGAVGGGPP